MSTSIAKRNNQLPEQLAIAGISLPPAENRMITSEGGLRIRTIDAGEIQVRAKEMMKWLSIDLGIQKVHDEYEQKYMEQRFIQILSTYYLDLTFSEVKLAFELLMMGELDQHLPKNKTGEAERGHFQMFNADFITKVLNAYRSRKQSLKGKIKLLLPEAEQMKTPEQIEEIKQQYGATLRDILERIAEGRELREWETSKYLYDMVVASTELEDGPPSPDDYQSALYECSTNQRISSYMRTEISEAWAKGEKTHMLEQTAQVIKRTRETISFIRKHPERIEDIMKYYYSK